MAMSRMFFFLTSSLPRRIMLSSTSTGARLADGRESKRRGTKLVLGEELSGCSLGRKQLDAGKHPVYDRRQLSTSSYSLSSECAATRASRESEVPHSSMRRGKR